MTAPPRSFSTPESWHRKNHRFPGPVEDCWECGKARAVCRAKIRYVTWADAQAACDEINEREAFARPVRRYVCRYCVGWHITSVLRGRGERRTAEKQRRKWLRRRAGQGAGNV